MMALSLKLGRRLKDECGSRFGKLTVVRRHPLNRDGCATWVCQCYCGGSRIVSGVDLRSGYIAQCVACAKEALREKRRTGRHPPFCAICNEHGHKTSRCKARRIERTGQMPCPVCLGMSWRVVGPMCRRCGIQYAPEPAWYVRAGITSSPIVRCWE